MSRHSVQSRVQGRRNPELGFLGSLLYKRQDAVVVAWTGHSPLPPLEGAKGQGETFCRLPGLRLPLFPLAGCSPAACLL